MKAYEELVEFIAAQSPGPVLEFQPSAETRQRVWDLIERRKDGSLDPAETSELDSFLLLEHVVMLAKARARRLLGHGS